MASEFDLIARYFSPPTSHTVLAGGDDAALIAVGDGMELAVSTDMLVEGRHFCMEMRGVAKPGAVTTTSAIRGAFEDDRTRQEFLSLVRGAK